MVSKTEKRWILGFALVIMILTSLPYLLGYAVQGENWRFSGFVFGVEDGNSYLGKMLRGSAGEWLFRTPYSALSQNGALIYLPYILLGKLVGSPGSHVQLASLYHLFRFSAGIMAILATYDFLAIFCTKVWTRRVGTVLVVLGGGLGWLLMLVNQKAWLGSLPLEFYSPESFGFLGIFGLPHLALARALLLWSLAWYLRLTNSEDNVPLKTIIMVGLLWLLTSLVQPLTGMIIGFVVGIYLVALAAWQAWRTTKGKPVDWPKWFGMLRVALVAGIIPATYWLYNIIYFEVDPFLRSWTNQNRVLSPHPAHYFLAFGIVIPLVIIGSRRILIKDAWRGWLLVGWVFSLPVLAYAPFTLQRRLPEGIWVALIVLVMFAIENWQIGRLERMGFVIGLVVVSTFSTLILWIGSVQAALKPGNTLFINADQAKVFEYLEVNAGKDEVVLAAYETGNALPAWTPQFVVIGHGSETAHFDKINARVADFFDEHSNENNRLRLLLDLGVDFVAWGPVERELGDWSPIQASYLKKIYQEGEYTLFEVIPPP